MSVVLQPTGRFWRAGYERLVASNPGLKPECYPLRPHPTSILFKDKRGVLRFDIQLTFDWRAVRDPIGLRVRLSQEVAAARYECLHGFGMRNLEDYPS